MKTMTLTALALVLALATACDHKSSTTSTTAASTSEAEPKDQTPEPKAAAVVAEPPPQTPTVDLSAALQDAMKTKARAAGWEFLGSSGMAVGSQAQTRFNLKKGGQNAEVYFVMPSGRADTASVTPRSLADQEAEYVKNGVPVRVKGANLIAVSVKKGTAMDAAASRKLFDALAK